MSGQVGGAQACIAASATLRLWKSLPRVMRSGELVCYGIWLVTKEPAAASEPRA
jgi:hypothetical protein